MKVTKIETFSGWASYCNWYFLRLETDNGLVGWGEGSFPGPLSAVQAAVQEMSALVLDREFEGTEVTWQRLYHAWRWRGGAVANTALSAFDLALWDLEGKSQKQPVYRLLGGAIRETVPAYSSHHLWKEPKQASVDARRAVENGYSALKWVLASIWDNRNVAASIDKAVDIMAAAREGAGRGCELFIDCSEMLTVETAKRLSKALEDIDIGFLEEPLPFENTKALIALIPELKTRVATGERLLSRWEYRELIESGLGIVLQPDLMHAGGLTEVRKIANAADTYFQPVAPHNAGGPISTAAAVHLGLSIPNFLILETMDDERALRDGICVQPMGPARGVFSMPTGTGLGIELDVDKLRTLKHRPSPLGRAPRLWLG